MSVNLQSKNEITERGLKILGFISFDHESAYFLDFFFNFPYWLGSVSHWQVKG